MKSLPALMVVGVGVAVVLYTRSENARTRTFTKQMVEESRAAHPPAAEIQRVNAATPYPQRKHTYIHGIGWVEHDQSVSPMQAIGAGGGYAGKPERARTRLTEQQFGWKSSSSLDQKPRR